MAEYLLGMNAKIYRGAAVAADSAFVGYAGLTEMSNVKDVTLNLSSAEADVTSRANSGWKATASGLREMSVEFQMVWKPGDAAFGVVKDVFLNADGTGKVVELAILDQPKTTSGAQGPQGFFAITEFKREEPLENAMMVSVTAKLVKYNSWVTVP